MPLYSLVCLLKAVRSLELCRIVSGSSDERARTSPNIVDDFIALSLLSPYLCYRLEPNLTWTRS